MFEKHLRQIKLHFSFLSIGLLILIGFGAVFITRSSTSAEFYSYLTMNYLNKNWDYFQYKNEKLPEVRLASRVQAETQQETSSLPVLMYHGIVEKPDGINVTKEEFKNQMQTLKNQGYTSISLQDAYDFLQKKKELPPRSILITFDDGRKDSYYGADPVLKLVGFRAVNFIITSHIDEEKQSTYYLNIPEIKQMLSTGRWEIGAHTHNGHGFIPIDAAGNTGHFLADKMWLADQNRLETNEEFTQRIQNDLQKSKEVLKKQFGVETIAFAFPFGDYGQEFSQPLKDMNDVINIANDLFPLSFYQVRAGEKLTRRNYPQKDIPLVKRIGVKSDWNDQELLSELQTSEDKNLPYTDDFSSDRGWMKLWGEFSLSKNNLTLFSTPSTTGALSILDGSFLWKNYDISATVEPHSGETFTLIGNFQDESNFVTCKFSAGRVSLEQKSQGETKTLRSWHTQFSFDPQTPVQLGMHIFENEVACTINNTIVVLDKNDILSSTSGAVGFTVWSDKAKSEMKVNALEVTPSEALPSPSTRVVLTNTLPTHIKKSTSSPIFTQTAEAAPLPAESTPPIPTPVSSPAQNTPEASTLPPSSQPLSSSPPVGTTPLPQSSPSVSSTLPIPTEIKKLFPPKLFVPPKEKKSKHNKN